MLSTGFQVAAAAFTLLAGPVDAYWRMPCGGTLVTERLDPIVFPGTVGSHVHIVLGGNAFGPTMDYAATQTSTCTSCAIDKDFSNYWVPAMYYAAQNGSFISVPLVGGQGGTVYYEQRVTYPGATLKAFPPGLRMVAGDPDLRTYSNTLEQNAISHVCLNYAGGGPPQGPALPSVNCPDGVRSQVYFPSCWDGVNLDSSDHKSHMSYPTGQNFDSGVCPDTHPVPLISLFYEFIFDTGSFANDWYGDSQPFVYSMGDTTGYGFHGDFLNGWDEATLQNAVDNFVTDDAGCADNVYCGGYFTQPAVSGAQCNIPSMVNEPITGVLPALPGCNPVTLNPEPVANCDATTTLGQVLSDIFTDETQTLGWKYLGCGTDTYGNPALTGPLADVQTMTVEDCIGICSGKSYSIAGLEYGSQCFCGNSIPARAEPTPGTIGACTEPCRGDSKEICGNANALSLYQQCASKSDCVNAQFGLNGGVGSGGSEPPAPVSTSPISTAPISTAPISTTPVSTAPVPPPTTPTTTAVSAATGVGNKFSATSVAPITTAPWPSTTADIVVPPTTTTDPAPSPSETDDPTTCPPDGNTVTLPSGWVEGGCYTDNLTPRSLTGIEFAWWGEAMTSSGCAKYCDDEDYSIAGTENGGQCFCGNSLSMSTKATSGCSTVCNGSANEICGGPALLSIFMKSGTNLSGATKAKRHLARHRRGMVDFEVKYA